MATAANPAAVVASTPVVAPAAVVAPIHLDEAQRPDDRPATESIVPAGSVTGVEPFAVADRVGAEPAAAEPAAGELFHASELGKVSALADDPQPEGGRPAGRRRRRKSAEPSETPQVSPTSEALPQEVVLPPSVDAISPLSNDGGL